VLTPISEQGMQEGDSAPVSQQAAETSPDGTQHAAENPDVEHDPYDDEDDDFEPDNTESEEETITEMLEDKPDATHDEDFIQASLGEVQMPTLEELNWSLTGLNISYEDLEKQIKVNFDSCDIDGSGTLDREELGDLLVKVSKLLVPGCDVPTKEDMEHAIDAAMKDLDTDANGTLDIKEFSKLVKMYVILSANMGSGARPLTPSVEQMNKRKAYEENLEQKKKNAIEQKLRDIGLTRKMVQKKIRETFSTWDADKNGTIDREELKPLLYALLKSLLPNLPKPSEQEMEAMVENEMKILDTDGNGVLERNEFAVLVKRYLIKMNEVKYEKKNSRPPTGRSETSSDSYSRSSSRPGTASKRGSRPVSVRGSRPASKPGSRPTSVRESRPSARKSGVSVNESRPSTRKGNSRPVSVRK